MKELVDQRTVQFGDTETNFLDIVFGLGEVTEICGLCSTGKSQICF
jgi:RecA/RadA recombinase